MSREYKRIQPELVLKAVEDMWNGNRPLTSKAYLQLRLAEVRYDRTLLDKQFKTFVEEKLTKVKE